MKSFRLSPNAFAFVFALVALLAALPVLAAETRPAPRPAATQPAGGPAATQPATTQAPSQPASAPANRWEPNIVRFEQQDAATPPPQNAILFVGSSSIAMWDTKKYFPDLTTIQRGFGGSLIPDSVYYAERVILPYRPRVLVFYAGDNDIAAGRPPQQLLADFQALVAKVRPALPQTRIVYISIKPSIARWNLIRQVRQANALIEAFTKTDPNMYYCDVDGPTLGADGKPRAELFKPDGLHLNHDGYVLWSSLLLPYLGEEPPAKAAIDWLTPRIIICHRGGSTPVAIKVPAGATVAWGNLPKDIGGDFPWVVDAGHALSPIACRPDAALGSHELTADVTAGATKTALTLQVDVVDPVVIESAAFRAGEPARVALRAQGLWDLQTVKQADMQFGHMAVTRASKEQPPQVKLSVPDGSGTIEPAELTVGDDKPTTATFTAPAGATKPVELTMTTGEVTQKHWLRPALMPAVNVSSITLDGDLSDWPAGARLDAHAAEISGAAAAPTACLGWSSGLWLAVSVAGPVKPADPEKWWAGANVEVFVDSAAQPAAQWNAATCRQFYILPVREGENWRATVGEYVREDAKGTSRYEDTRCRTAIAVTDAGWTIEAFIPAEALGAAPAANTTWRALVSVQTPNQDGTTSVAAWPRLKPKDVTNSSLWGDLRFEK